MKKKILAIAMFVALGLSASAQSDGFFASNYNEFRDGNKMGGEPAMIGHGLEADQKAPVGNGLLILGGLALAYGIRKMK